MSAAAREARDAVERFRMLTAQAVAACDGDRTHDLVALLRARDEVACRLWQVDARDGRGTTPRPALRPTPVEVRELRLVAADALRLNNELARRVAAARDNARSQLQRLEHDQAGVDGYARAMPRPRQLDQRR